MKQDDGERLLDRTGQVWAYIDRPFVFLARGKGPQSSTAPYNEWLLLDLSTGEVQSTRLGRTMPMEGNPRWVRLA